MLKRTLRIQNAKAVSEKLLAAVKWVGGMITFISLIGGISWRVAVWVTEKNTKAENVEMVAVMVQQGFSDLRKEVADTLAKHGAIIRAAVVKLDKVAADQEQLTTNYVRYVRDNTQFTKDFTRYMEGLTFKIDIPQYGEPRISIKKVQ